uniref:Uncharacterized protein n=1 Tax=Molossus molossus TaxID=27622 RepID=A0A7J8CZP8_MOLMO|nr:hypothetical protein HJG59_009502 [Molossus molossus]
MALVYEDGGGERWVHPALRPRSLQLTATPEGRAAGAATCTLPCGPQCLESGVFATSPVQVGAEGESRYAGPRRHTQAEWGWDKNLAELDRMICVPVESQKSRFTRSLPNWGLGKHAVITQEPRPL